MIKFFRNIRQNLLIENPPEGRAGKTGKYLKYAIGEIILVVIGILIALQINTWNNEQNRKKAEEVIIEQLKADLTTSQTELEELVEFLQGSAKASAVVCHAFWKDKTPQDTIYQYMRRPLGTKLYSPTIGTARSLVVSGNMSLIKSDDLKNEITSYLEKIEYSLRDISRYEETYFRKGVNLISEKVTISSLAPKSYYLKRIEQSNDPNFATSRNDEYSEIPNAIEKILFEANLNDLFHDQKIYNAYSSLLVAHRNTSNRYNDMLEITNELLAKLEKASNND